MSVNQIGQLASGLLEYEFDYITGSNNRSSELTTISGSLSGKLGELNVVLNQSFTFTGDDGNPYPRLGQEEGDILQLLYMRDYNTKQAQKLLRGIYDANVGDSIVNANGDWIELSEGDTTIRRSPTALANSPSARMSTSKEFKEMAKEADAQIKDLVYRYNMYGAEPVQVAGNDAPDLEFAKDCVQNKINFIGICCGAEAHHVREMSVAIGKKPISMKYMPDMSKHFHHGTDKSLNKVNKELKY